MEIDAKKIAELARCIVTTATQTTAQEAVNIGVFKNESGQNFNLALVITRADKNQKPLPDFNCIQGEAK